MKRGALAAAALVPGATASLTRQGQAFMPKGVLFEHGPIAHGERPGNLVRFFECRDVLVHGVTIQNSPTWTSHYRKCENVTIEAVRIHSDALEDVAFEDVRLRLERLHAGRQRFVDEGKID